jgi:non-ribosomal peptide synthetase component F
MCRVGQPLGGALDARRPAPFYGHRYERPFTGRRADPGEASLHPSVHARVHPDKPAYVMAGSGETVTYGQLEERSNRLAQMFRARGLRAGDHIALMMENNPRFFEICWGAQRAGLYYTASRPPKRTTSSAIAAPSSSSPRKRSTRRPPNWRR